MYWVLFPIENLRQAVETAKRILKEKIDRQLAAQFSPTPFMSVKDSYNKKVTFDTLDRLEDKIDKLTAMMGKLVARYDEVSRSFNHRSIKAKEEDEVESFMIYITMTEETIKQV